MARLSVLNRAFNNQPFRDKRSSRTLPITHSEVEGSYVKDALVIHRLCIPYRHHIGVCANGACSSGWAHLPDRGESRIGRWLENATGQTYQYTGTITRLGLDVGVTGGGRLFWGVFAQTSHIGPGTLRGNYVGASGNASLGFGLGANVLVGGSNRTISLQPLSVEGQVGVNLAVGVAGLRLR
jgi:hypothetical protein